MVWAAVTQENAAALTAGRVRHQEMKAKSQSGRSSHLCANPPKSSADLCREDAKGPTRKDPSGGTATHEAGTELALSSAGQASG